MKTPTLKERAALAQMETYANAEEKRAALWDAMKLRDKQRAVGVAGMGKECAELPLSAFNDTDREHIRLALITHIGAMELVQQCMAGQMTNVHGYLH